MKYKPSLAAVITLGTSAGITGEVLLRKEHFSLLPIKYENRKTSLGVHQYLRIDIDGKDPEVPSSGSDEIDSIKIPPASRKRLNLPNNQDLKELALLGDNSTGIPASILGLFDTEIGARGFRLVSEAYIERNYNQIKKQIKNMLLCIRRNIDGCIKAAGEISAEDLHLWIVFFTGGGTGSGAVIKICRIIQEAARESDIKKVTVSLVGVLPGAEVSVDPERVKANTDALIKELYGTLLNGEGLFKHLFLEENINAENKDLSFKNVFCMIANIMHVLHSTPAGDEFYGRLSDAENQLFSPDKKYGAIRFISSLGGSRIFQPEPIDYCAHRLARKVLENSLQEPDEQFVDKLIEEFTVTLKLNTAEGGGIRQDILNVSTGGKPQQLNAKILEQFLTRADYLHPLTRYYKLSNLHKNSIEKAQEVFQGNRENIINQLVEKTNAGIGKIKNSMGLKTCLKLLEELKEKVKDDKTQVIEVMLQKAEVGANNTNLEIQKIRKNIQKAVAIRWYDYFLLGYFIQLIFLRKLVSQFQDVAHDHVLCQMEILARTAEKEIMEDYLSNLDEKIIEFRKKMEEECKKMAEIESQIEKKKDVNFDFHVSNGSCLVTTEDDYDRYYEKTMIFASENEAVKVVINNLLKSGTEPAYSSSRLLMECEKCFKDNLNVQDEILKYGDVAAKELLKDVIAKAREFLVINEAELREEDKVFLKIICCKGAENSPLARMLKEVIADQNIFFVDNDSSRIIDFITVRAAIPPFAVKALVRYEDSYKKTLEGDRKDYGAYLVHTSKFSHLLPDLTPYTANDMRIWAGIARGLTLGKISLNGKFQFAEGQGIEMGRTIEEAKEFFVKNQHLVGKIFADFIRELENNPEGLNKRILDASSRYQLDANIVKTMIDEVKESLSKNGKS